MHSFWLETYVDGKPPTAVAPRPPEEGTFRVDVSQRKAGDMIRSLRVTGRVEEGDLILDVLDGEGELVYHTRTAP